MKSILPLLLVIITYNSLCAQDAYDVTWSTQSYQPLNDYGSVILDNVLENGYSLWWQDETAFDFGFEFPYFGNSFNQVILESDGVGYFPGNDDTYNLYLYAGLGYENPGNLSNQLIADWRYQLDTVDQEKVFKIEWFNVSLVQDLDSDTPSDHALNYQVWFYESGVVELHFGEFDLENTPFFDLDRGILDEDGEIFGPWVGIGNNTETDVYYVSNTVNEPEVIFSEPDSDVLTGIPPEGWVVRFEPAVPTSLTHLDDDYKLKCYPNIISPNDMVYWDINDANVSPEKLYVYNHQGKLISSLEGLQSRNAIQLPVTNSGMYYLQFVSSTGEVITRRIMVMMH